MMCGAFNGDFANITRLIAFGMPSLRDLGHFIDDVWDGKF
jgi:hypothetical protein